MNRERSHNPSRQGFTLIELLVVIAVIALLAGMIFPVTHVVTRNKIRSKTRAELKQIELAIDGYKAKLGYLPPGNTNNFAFNTLFYELSGTSKQGSVFETLDKSATITEADLFNVLGMTGLMNSMVGAGSDEGASAQRFPSGPRPLPSATVLAGAEPSTAPRVLTTSVGWKNEATPIFPTNPKVSPVYYNPVNPTNNPNSYDLWVDVIVGGKTNRISNWSTEPIVLQ